MSEATEHHIIDLRVRKLSHPSAPDWFIITSTDDPGIFIADTSLQTCFNEVIPVMSALRRAREKDA